MKNKGFIIFLKILSVVYLVALFYFLFFSDRYYRNADVTHNYNLKPFAEISRYIKYYNSFTEELFVVNIIGNIAGFIPLGVIIPLWIKSARSFLVSSLCIMCVSSLIESLQLLTNTGSFDVDDIILNTIGGIIGYIFFKAFYKFIFQKRSEN